MRKGENVKSNFSFSHNVFYSYISLVHQNTALCGNGLIQTAVSGAASQSWGPPLTCKAW